MSELITKLQDKLTPNRRWSNQLSAEPWAFAMNTAPVLCTRLVLCLWMLVTLSSPNAWCQKVLERDGDLFLEENGKAQQLTHGGDSHYPFLASGCATVFFVRDFRHPDDALKLDHSEIWSQGLWPRLSPSARGPFSRRSLRPATSFRKGCWLRSGLGSVNAGGAGN